MHNERGLYNKYTVIDNASGKPVSMSTFVLRPDKDPASLQALKAYADHTDNKQLARDIYKWIEDLGNLPILYKIRVKGDQLIGPGEVVPFRVLRQQWISQLLQVQADGSRVVEVRDVESDEIEVKLEVPQSLSKSFNNSASSVSLSVLGITQDASH